MHKFVSFNHEIVSANNIKINALSSAGLYGIGVFTTIAIYNSKPFLWEKHWRRLNDNAQKLGIDISKFDEQKVRNSLSSIIKKNEVKNARCRLTFFDESSSMLWDTSDRDKTSLLIQTADQHKKVEELSVYISAVSINTRSPLNGIKSCNYLENILALQEAKKYDFDEGIRCNEKGEVVSFCMGNVFWLEFNDEKIYTPSLETGCLAGTTREFIIENFEVMEIEKDISEFLRNVETVLITSSGIGVAQLTDLDGRKINSDPHKLTKFIQSKLEKS